MILRIALIIFAFILQAVSIAANIYIWNLEKKYCSKCDWWSDIAMCIMVGVGFIPIIGIIMPAMSVFDVTRNVINEIENNKN